MKVKSVSQSRAKGAVAHFQAFPGMDKISFSYAYWLIANFPKLRKSELISIDLKTMVHLVTIFTTIISLEEVILNPKGNKGNPW